VNLPMIQLTYGMGSPPDSSTYTGGTLLTGYYSAKTVTHYGNGTYSGPQQAQYKIDTTAQTIEIAERAGMSTYYIGMYYQQTDAHTLHATVACTTLLNAPMTHDYAYTLTVGNPSTLTLTEINSSDVFSFFAP
jgi:hypothetical protein